MANKIAVTYTTPTGDLRLADHLPALPPVGSSSEGGLETEAAKTAYLADLRLKLTTVQDGINSFLTRKMAEDNKADAATSSTAAAAVDSASKSAAGTRLSVRTRDEQREEDMYGEEEVGEDD